jgi:hypothetical protein
MSARDSYRWSARSLTVTIVRVRSLLCCGDQVWTVPIQTTFPLGSIPNFAHCVHPSVRVPYNDYRERAVQAVSLRSFIPIPVPWAVCEHRVLARRHIQLVWIRKILEREVQAENIQQKVRSRVERPCNPWVGLQPEPLYRFSVLLASFEPVHNRLVAIQRDNVGPGGQLVTVVPFRQLQRSLHYNC